MIVALHPGTVNSGLSQPFRGVEIGRPATHAGSEMLLVLDSLRLDDSASLVAYSGERMPW